MLERLGAFGRARIPKNYTPPDPPSTPSTCLKRIYRFSGRLREIFQAPAHPAAVIIGFLSTILFLSFSRLSPNMVQATNAVPHSPPSFRSASSDYPPISSEQEMRQSSVCQRMAMIDRRMRKLNDKYFPKANTTLRDDQRLIISTTAYEEAWYVRGHLITLLAYTTPSTIIVLHLNANSTYTTDEISSFYSLAPRRLILNHIRYPVRAYHGTLLRALLGNVEEVRRIGLSFGYVLLMCSNAWLVRGGIEKWIGRYKASLTKEMNPDEVYEDQSGKIAKAYEWAGMRLV
ncbi:hypothetical protein AAMO2058_001706200, partial [Amorphochlora amoebiformis]